MLSVTHTTPADGTFTPEGKAAWDAEHQITGPLTAPVIAGDTWANRVNYQTTPFSLLRITDTALAGSLFQWDGTWWNPVGVPSLLMFGIPFIRPSSGSIGDNGALTGITALPSTYGNAYMYFPADAIHAGSAAGWYFAQMSSTTAGTIFNNTYSTGNPTIPASPTAFSTTGPGAYTQVLTEVTGPNAVVPASSMRLNGQLHTIVQWSNSNGASNKTLRVRFTASLAFHARAVTVTDGHQVYCRIANRGEAGRQVSYLATRAGFEGPITGTTTYGNADTSADQTISISMQVATAASDWVIAESADISLH